MGCFLKPDRPFDGSLMCQRNELGCTSGLPNDTTRRRLFTLGKIHGWGVLRGRTLLVDVKDEDGPSSLFTSPYKYTDSVQSRVVVTTPWFYEGLLRGGTDNQGEF